MGCHASKGDVVDAHERTDQLSSAPAAAKGHRSEAQKKAVIADAAAATSSPAPNHKDASDNGTSASEPKEGVQAEVTDRRPSQSSGSTSVPEDIENSPESLWSCSPEHARVAANDLSTADISPATNEEPTHALAEVKDWKMEAQRALDEAAKLMRTDRLVLKAEAVLCETYAKLVASESGAEGDEAAKVMRDAPIFLEICERAQQYNSIAAILRPNSYKLQWEKDNACLWVNAPPGETWFEFKVAGFFNVPIQHVMVALHELDLQCKYQPMLAGPPQFLGERSRHLMITRTLVDILVFRIELIIEVMRFVDHDFGFLAERIRSDFPVDKSIIPAKHWRNKRITADTRSMVIPCGGGKQGTITMQATKVDLGFQLPRYLLDFFCTKLSQDYLNNLRTCLKLVAEPGSPWSERLEKDADGFYAELAKADEVAANRAEVNLQNLPPENVFDRPWKLSDALAASSTSA